MQLLIFAIALGWGLCGCVERFSHPDRVETARSHLTDAEYAAELMTDLPVWVRTNEFSGYSTGLFTASDVAAYAYAASELAGMSKADVRAGLLLAQAEAYDEGFVEGSSSSSTPSSCGACCSTSRRRRRPRRSGGGDRTLATRRTTPGCRAVMSTTTTSGRRSSAPRAC
ncbi:MAG: hypothetical protein R3F60_06195 [bacterium]